jgi:hypothetical protein
MPYIKVGASIRLRVSEIEMWLDGNRFIPTQMKNER